MDYLDKEKEFDTKIFVNSLELSQNTAYILVNVSIVEYKDGSAFCAHNNKDVLISLIDFRSPTENKNPGFSKKSGSKIFKTNSNK